MVTKFMPFFIPEPEPATPNHVFTITVAGSNRFSGLVGYWFNNQGAIENADFVLPNGRTTSIRQCMTGSFIGPVLRFVTSRTINDLAQLPPTITTTRGIHGPITWTRGDTLLTVGQGQGSNYTPDNSGLITTVFQAGLITTVTLHYS